MIIVSSREFRDKQKNYLDKVDEGIEVLIHRGANKSYRIVPVEEDDILISKDDMLVPDEDYYRAITMDEAIAKVHAGMERIIKKHN